MAREAHVQSSIYVSINTYDGKAGEKRKILAGWPTTY